MWLWEKPQMANKAGEMCSPRGTVCCVWYIFHFSTILSLCFTHDSNKIQHVELPTQKPLWVMNVMKPQYQTDDLFRTWKIRSAESRRRNTCYYESSNVGWIPFKQSSFPSVWRPLHWPWHSRASGPPLAHVVAMATHNVGPTDGDMMMTMLLVVVVGSWGFCFCIWATDLRTMTSVTSPGETLARWEKHATRIIGRTRSAVCVRPRARLCLADMSVLFAHFKYKTLLYMQVCYQECVSIHH